MERSLFLAASLYHLIVGHAPVDGQRRLAALAAKEPDPYEPLSGRIEGYTPAFLKAIDKALHSLPADRLQTAEEWLDMLGVRKRSVLRPSRRPVSAATDRTTTLILPIEDFAAPLIERIEGKTRQLKVGAAAAAIGIVAVIGLIAFGADTDTVAPAESLATDEGTTRGPAEVDTSLAGAASPDTSDVASLTADTRPAMPRVAAPEPDAPLPDDIAGLPLAPVASDPALSDAEAQPGPVFDTVAGPEAPFEAEIGPLVLTALSPPPDTVDVPRVAALLAPVGSAPALNGASPRGFAEIAEPAPEPRVAFETSDTRPGSGSVQKLPALPAMGRARGDIAVVGNADAMFDLDSTTGLGVSVPDVAPVRALPVLAVRPDLPALSGEAGFDGDVSPPPAYERAGRILENQLGFSHWDVDMPFTSAAERIRNSNTIRIASVDPDAALDVAGSWIAEDVVIYSFNGEKLIPDAPMSVHLLTDMVIDPDGYVRATVRYRDPADGRIDRGLLAVPAIRQIGLSDGTLIEARMEDLAWVMTVIEPGDGSALQAGDRIKAETTTGRAIQGHEDLADALTQLASGNRGTAEFTVLRGESETQVSWRLAREE